MATSKPGSRWEQLRERTLTDPLARERYDQTRRTLATLRSILETIDAEREQAGLSKTALAERMGVSPASVRRLFTSEGSNPTLVTILGMLDVLGLELAVQPRPTGGNSSKFTARQDEIRALSVADAARQRTDRLRRVM